MSRTVKIALVFLAMVSLAAIPLLDALAQGPIPPLGYKIGKPILPKPDLVVQVTGYYPSGTPLPNGGLAQFGGGNVAIPIKVAVKNRGLFPIAVPTQTKVVIVRGGTAVVNTFVTETPPLAAGAIRTHGFVVTCPAITNHISAQATVDAGGALAESNEANNHASYSCTVTVVH